MQDVPINEKCVGTSWLDYCFQGSLYGVSLGALNEEEMSGQVRLCCSRDDIGWTRFPTSTITKSITKSIVAEVLAIIVRSI